MDLRIVAQRLKVPHTLYAVGNGFLVEDPACIKGDLHREPLGNQAAQHLQLHLTHNLGVELPGLGLPNDAQQGILLFQKPQLLQCSYRVLSFGKIDPVGHNRL